MKTILFALPGNEQLANQLSIEMNVSLGDVVVRRFPDGESFVQIKSDVKGKVVVLVCTLHEPDSKLLPLFFLSKTAMDLGAKNTCLITPYLAYMRQDKRFHSGEGITSEYFGSLISMFASSLITIDPHLHRRHSLSEIYSIKSAVIHAASEISNWIKVEVKNPVLIGPDSESEQWVSEVANRAKVPFIILEKIRYGDKEVEVSIPQVDGFKQHTPVLVDDIISTARTMIETVGHLKKAGMKSPICIGVHAVFAGDAYQNLLDTGVERVVTCNTIEHQSNGINMTKLIAQSFERLHE